jgi:hypothetical protein
LPLGYCARDDKVINTILKLSCSSTPWARFDTSADERETANFIDLFADEGQEVITGAESPSWIIARQALFERRAPQ